MDHDAVAILGSRPRRASGQSSYMFWKRAIDLAIAAPALIVALPLMILASALIKIVDPGPALFVQPRICKGGKLRPIYKIRTMYLDADARLAKHLANNPAAREEWGSKFKLRNDPRILPIVGKLIRVSSIDELPQLWNVIRGDISLVGPRPFPIYHVESFDSEFQELRCSVPQGLTGYWQIMARSRSDLEIQKRQDLYYIQNRSLALDLYIILMTVPAVIFGKGAE